MVEPEAVAALLRLKGLGWGSKRIARELGLSRGTVKRYVEAGGWQPFKQPRRSKLLDELHAENFGVYGARKQAVHGRRPTEPGLIHHGVRGVQYVSIKYTGRLAEAGIDPSVGSVGESYANAPAWTVIGLLETEVIHHQGPWRSLAAVEVATINWVDWYNTRRLLGSIGDIPPAEAEANHHAALEATPMAAWDSNKPASEKPRAVHSGSRAPTTASVPSTRPTTSTSLCSVSIAATARWPPSNPASV